METSESSEVNQVQKKNVDVLKLNAYGVYRSRLIRSMLFARRFLLRNLPRLKLKMANRLHRHSFAYSSLRGYDDDFYEFSFGSTPSNRRKPSKGWKILRSIFLPSCASGRQVNEESLPRSCSPPSQKCEGSGKVFADNEEEHEEENGGEDSSDCNNNSNSSPLSINKRAQNYISAVRQEIEMERLASFQRYHEMLQRAA